MLNDQGRDPQVGDANVAEAKLQSTAKLQANLHAKAVPVAGDFEEEVPDYQSPWIYEKIKDKLDCDQEKYKGHIIELLGSFTGRRIKHCEYGCTLKGKTACKPHNKMGVSCQGGPFHCDGCKARK